MVCASVKGKAAFPELVPFDGDVCAAPSGRVSQAIVAAGTACRDFVRVLPRMEIATLFMFLV